MAAIIRFASIISFIVFPMISFGQKSTPAPVKWCYVDDYNVRCFEIVRTTLPKMETASKMCQSMTDPDDVLKWNLPKVDTNDSMKWIRNLTLRRNYAVKKIIFWLGLVRKNDSVGWSWLLSNDHAHSMTYYSILQDAPWSDRKWQTDSDKKCVLAVLGVENPNPSIKWFAVSCSTQNDTIPDALKNFSQILVCEQETFGTEPDNHSLDSLNGNHGKNKLDEKTWKPILYSLIGVVAFLTVLLIIVIVICIVRGRHHRRSNCSSTDSFSSSTVSDDDNRGKKKKVIIKKKKPVILWTRKKGGKGKRSM